MQFSTFYIVFVLALSAGCILLQIYLSNKENKWLGFLLPALSFAYSLIAALSFVTYNGEVGWYVAGMVFVTFLMSNIPTLVLLGVYWICRDRIRRRKELEKMNVHDLG